MKILITASSSWGNAADYKLLLKDFKYEEVGDEDYFKTYVEINSLEDLEKLNEAVDHKLVVDFRKTHKNFNDEPFIEIYDTWRE